jgi:chromosome segregation ATPase
MSGGGPDLENLERYLAIATNALERLQSATPAIQAEGEALDQLEHDVDSKLSEFDSENQGFIKDVDRHETDALAEVSKLTALAHDAAESRLPDAQHDLEEAGTRIEHSMDAGGQELTNDHHALDSDGFGHLISTLDATQQAFNTIQAHNEAAFQALGHALTDLEHQAETAYAESGRELEAADTEADQEAGTLGTETSTLVQNMDAAGNEFHGQVGQVESEAETAYDGVNEQVASETQELTDGVLHALEAEAQHLATELTDSIETSSSMVVTDSAGPHLAELGTLHQAVWKAESASADLEPLVGDLHRCQSVVEMVEKLLNAMQ